LLHSPLSLKPRFSGTLTVRLSAGRLRVIEHPLAPRVKFAAAFRTDKARHHATSEFIRVNGAIRGLPHPEHSLISPSAHRLSATNVHERSQA
jgi:hypothetical protein